MGGGGVGGGGATKLVSLAKKCAEAQLIQAACQAVNIAD